MRPIQRTDSVVSVAITGDMSDADLKCYAEEVRERLQRVPERLARQPARASASGRSASRFRPRP